MDADSRLSLLFIFVLLFFAAFFAVSETSFAAASQTKLKVAADRGDDRAKFALYIIDHIEVAISTLLILTNIVHISVATIVTVMVTKLWGISFVSISTIVTTIVVFFVGEMLPKSIAKKNPEKFSLRVAGVIYILMKIFGPLAMILTKIGLLAAGLTKGEPELTVTEDELLDIFEDLTEEGVIDEEQEDMMSSVLDFTDTKTGKILTHKRDVVGIDINIEKEKILPEINAMTHSRVIVYDGKIDNVLGILRIRNFLKKYMQTGTVPEISEVMDEPYWVNSTTAIDDLLEEMSEARQNIALVKGVNGQFIGLVSIEDILEELVGDILDESDEDGGEIK